jgi:hypothetical protein
MVGNHDLILLAFLIIGIARVDDVAAWVRDNLRSGQHALGHSLVATGQHALGLDFAGNGEVQGLRSVLSIIGN